MKHQRVHQDHIPDITCQLDEIAFTFVQPRYEVELLVAFTEAR